jgi:hypothetical protein
MAKRGEQRLFQLRLYAHGTAPEGAGDAGRVGWARGEVIDTRTDEVLAARLPEEAEQA